MLSVSSRSSSIRYLYLLKTDISRNNRAKYGLLHALQEQPIARFRFYIPW